jgi:hypothetical protein
MTLTQLVAANVQVKLTFGMELEAISILLSLLSKCFFNSSTSEQTPSEYLQRHWNVDTQTFDQPTLVNAKYSTYKAIRIHHRKNGGKRLRDYTADEIDQLTNATLKEAMDQPAHVAMAVNDEAPNFGDDDDEPTSSDSDLRPSEDVDA